jgi:hypothetical protein
MIDCAGFENPEAELVNEYDHDETPHQLPNVNGVKSLTPPDCAKFSLANCRYLLELSDSRDDPVQTGDIAFWIVRLLFTNGAPE